MGQDLIIPPQRCGELATLASTTSMTRIVARPNPFTAELVDLQLACGGTILDMLEVVVGDPSQLRYYHCWLTDAAMSTDPIVVDRKYWHLVRPKPGIVVTFRAAPHGGGGGSKGILGIVLRVVVTVIAAVATWYVGGIGGAFVGAAISVAGNLAISALVPPPRPPQPPKLSDSRVDSPSYSITGSKNQANPYGPIPRIFGRFRYTPPYGAQPYTEILGSDQYIRLLFCFGYGPLQIEDIKIGETPIDNYEDVQIVIRYGYDDDGPLTLYSNDIHEEQFSVEITNDFIHTPAVAATGTLTLSANLSAGDTVSVGNKTYTAVVALTNTVPNQVLIGAVAIDTVNNLIAAILHSAGAGSLYSSSTVAHTQVTAGPGTGAVMKVTAQATGIAGNNIATVATGGHATWAAGKLSGGAVADKINTIIVPGVGFLDVLGGATVSGTTYFAGVTFIENGIPREMFLDNFPAAINGLSPGNPIYHAARIGNTIKVTSKLGNNAPTSTTSTNLRWRAPTLLGGLTAYQTDPLDLDEKWISRTSQDNADELTGDITFPQGLVHYTPLGDKAPVTCRFDIRYRISGSDDPWLYHSTQATATFTPAGNAVDGAQMTIGITTYTFQSVLTNVAGNVAIGATAAISLANLAAAINLTPGAGTAYAAATVINPTIAAEIIDGKLVVTAKHLGNSSGTDGNLFAVYGDGFPGAWDDLTLHGGVDAINVTGKDTIARTSFRIILPVRGEYDIQIRRLTQNATDTETFDRAYWSVLRTVRYNQAFTLPGVATMEMRIRATDQLNGVVDTLNGVCTSILDVYDSETDTWSAKPTRNPAWCDLQILRGRANKSAVGLDQIYLPDYVDWAADNDVLDDDGNPRFSCDGVIDYAGTVRDVRADICSSGRATPGLRDGKLTIVRDVLQTVPVQHITPRNSRNTKWNKPFVDMPDGLKVRFTNEDKGWQIDEQVVYTDGFTAENARKFETFNVPLTTRWPQVYRDTRYHLGVIKERPLTYQRSMDPEYLMARRGDLVHSSDDVLLHGLGSGRIKSVVTDEDGLGIEIITDERFTMAAGGSYALEIRRADNTPQIVSLQTVAGESNALMPLLPLAADNLPERGDLVAFGEAGRVTVAMIVKAVTPDNDLGATLTLIDAAPAVHTADQGALPPFDSQITQPVPIALRRPSPPTIVAIQSDETVLVRQPDGSLTTVIVITLGALSSGAVPARTVEVQLRRTGGMDTWHPAVTASANVATVTIGNVDDGETYDLRLRNIGTSTSSDWLMRTAYKVIGKTTPPPAPVSMRQEGSWARWEYPLSPRDFAGFRPKDMAGGNLSWDAGALLNGGQLLTDPQLDLSGIGSGVHAIMIKAVDTADNESDDFTYLVVNIGDVTTDNIVVAVDLAALGFPGTVTGGSVVDGVLRADLDDTAIWSSDPNAPIWSSDPDAPIWQVSASALIYEIAVTPPDGAVPSQLKLITDISGDGWRIEYDPGNQSQIWPADQTAPIWPSDPEALIWPAGGGYVPWPGQIAVERQSYRIRITINAGATQGRINALKLIFDVPDESEPFRDLIIPAEGLRLPLSKAFSLVTLVKITLQDDGGTAVNVLLVDKGIVNKGRVVAGPLLVCIDKDRNPTAGLVDVEVDGAQGAES